MNDLISRRDAIEKRTQERTKTHACDLIDRQAAIDEIEYELEMINSALDSITLDFNARERLRQRRGEAREILNSIQQLPSAQHEIIRCKDCKHSEHWYRDKSRCFLWHEEGIDVFNDGFCNYAERKEGEADG